MSMSIGSTDTNAAQVAAETETPMTTHESQNTPAKVADEARNAEPEDEDEYSFGTFDSIDFTSDDVEVSS